MRDQSHSPPPAPAQAAPTAPIYDPRYWLLLTPAFMQVLAAAGTREPALIYINQCWHNGLLELALAMPDGTLRPLDAQGRTIHAPHHPEEGVRIEPPFEECSSQQK